MPSDPAKEGFSNNDPKPRSISKRKQPISRIAELLVPKRSSDDESEDENRVIKPFISARSLRQSATRSSLHRSSRSKKGIRKARRRELRLTMMEEYYRILVYAAIIKMIELRTY